MPRIAHVISTPAGIGGAERVLEAVVRGGADRKWQQLVLNPFASDPDTASLREVLPSGTYRGFRCGRWREVPALRRWLGAHVRSFEPDVIHAHLFHASVSIASLRRSCAARVMTHHHGDEFAVRANERRETLDRLAGRRYDRIVCVSRWAREFLISRYGYRPNRLELIVNGWSGRPLPPTPPPDSPTVICTANFRGQKGHDVLVAAFAEVQRRIPSARLLLVGDGELEDAIRADVAAKGLESSVRFCGKTDDVWSLLAKAHVFAMASRWEPLGIAILEAMAAGLPVVATAVGGIPELVKPGVTGELAPPGDARLLADRLIQVLSDPGGGAAMGRTAAEAAANMTSENMVGRHFALYDRLLSRDGGEGR